MAQAGLKRARNTMMTKTSPAYEAQLMGVASPLPTLCARADWRRGCTDVMTKAKKLGFSQSTVTELCQAATFDEDGVKRLLASIKKLNKESQKMEIANWTPSWRPATTTRTTCATPPPSATPPGLTRDALCSVWNSTRLRCSLRCRLGLNP